MNIDAICATLGLDPLARGLQILDAAHLARLHFPPLDPDAPALIARLNTHALATECQRALLLLYPRDHLVTRLVGEKKEIERLRDCARGDKFDPETFLFLPPLARPGSFNALANIVAHLRSPVGCPWDRAQTHQSLRKDFLEECYEVLETLDENDIPHLREELGDLMLHILLQTQIAYQANEFGLSEMIAEISEKLVRRHPHVFSDVVVNGTDEIVANWEKIKQREKGEGKSKKSDVPLALPALMRAQKIANGKKRLSNREIQRLVARLPRARNKEKVLGEALFALAAYAQEKHLDAETALRSIANEKSH